MSGYVKYDPKMPSPMPGGEAVGFDGVYIKGDLANPEIIIISEGKQVNSNGGITLRGENKSSGLPAQMSDDWIENVARRMQEPKNTIVTKNLKSIISRNKGKITKIIIAVDKSTGEINILRLEKY